MISAINGTLAATTPCVGHNGFRPLMDHLSYWNSEAARYDDLYSDDWSARENAHVQHSLEFIKDIDRPKILDLGCGTGLAYELCYPINPFVEYVGIDISPAMRTQLLKKHPHLEAHIGSMENLSQFPDNSFDLVMSTFSSMSCIKDLDSVFSEARRVLFPGRYLRVSVLNQTALRRLVRLKFSRLEIYQTRHSEDPDHPDHSVLMRLYTKSELKRLGSKFGFELVRVDSIGVFANLTEKPYLWNLDKKLSNVFPWLANTTDLLFKLDR